MHTFYDWLQLNRNYQEMSGSMNWGDISDMLRKSACNEMRRTGSCHHERCQKANDLADRVEFGRTPSEEDQAAKFFFEKQCGASRAGRFCGHPGCRIAQRAVDYIKGASTDTQSLTA